MQNRVKQALGLLGIFFLILTVFGNWPQKVEVAHAAVAFVQSASATNNTAGTTLATAFPSNNTAGNLIAVAMSFDSFGGTTWSCSDTRGNTYTQATFTNDTRHGQTLGICYAANITAGANTVTVSFGGVSQLWRRMAIAEYSGVATASPLDGTATNNAGTNTTSVTTNSLTTTQAGDLIFAAVTPDSGTTTSSAGAGFTLRQTTSDVAIDDQLQVSLGSIAGTFTFASASDYIAHAVAFKPAGGGGGDSTPPTVSITAPSNGATVSTTTTFSATANDNVAVAGVTFKLDGNAITSEDTSSPYSINWDTTLTSNASHTLTATARDTSNNTTTSSSISVTVSNVITPPPPPPPPPPPGTYPWSNIISGARATDWSKAGVVGGIPNIANQCGSTLASSSTQGQINTAINNCATIGGGYVLLGSGTFNLGGPPILKSNVVLRGSGMGTILNVTGSAGSSWYWGGGGTALVIAGANASPADAVPPISSVNSSTIKTWTGTNGVNGTYTQGATVLNLGSAPTGLVAGDMLVCWENNVADASLPNNGLFFSAKTGTNAIAWQGSYDDHGGSMEQRSLVTAINGTSVTIADPLAHPTGAWTTGQNPRCGWIPSSQTIRNAGVENFLIQTTNWGSAHQCVICIAWGYNVWVKGVGLKPRFTSFHGGGAVDYGIIAIDSLHVTIRDSWIDTMRGGGVYTTTSYGVAMKETHFSLVENNIYNNVESPQEMLIGSMGDVVGYNYERYVGDDGQEGGVQQHEVASSMNLVEGNTYLKFFADEFHGNTGLNTYFRNNLTGGGFDLWSYHRWYNLIGNVINASTAYQSLATDSTKYDRWSGVGFRLGYPQQNASNATTSGVAFDPVVWTSLFRWGNYVTAGASTRWLAADVPTADPVFPNAVPATQTLPASFYLSAKPSWWPTAKPWPATGPDVTGGSVAGYAGHVYTTPAQDCYTSSGTLANFNPSTCYTSSGTPPPPPPPTPIVGDINLDHIVNSIDYSILNSKWFTNDAASDLNHDGIVNAIDNSLLNANWFKTW